MAARAERASCALVEVGSFDWKIRGPTASAPLFQCHAYGVIGEGGGVDRDYYVNQIGAVDDL